jgi:hypothetical protein
VLGPGFALRVVFVTGDHALLTALPLGETGWTIGRYDTWCQSRD